MIFPSHPFTSPLPSSPGPGAASISHQNAYKVLLVGDTDLSHFLLGPSIHSQHGDQRDRKSDDITFLI